MSSAAAPSIAALTFSNDDAPSVEGLRLQPMFTDAPALAVSHGLTFGILNSLDQGAKPRRHTLLQDVVVPGAKRMPDHQEHLVVGDVEGGGADDP
jgi:hypothetical protein